jgi:hypothetical protein
MPFPQKLANKGGGKTGRQRKAHELTLSSYNGVENRSLRLPFFTLHWQSSNTPETAHVTLSA